MKNIRGPIALAGKKTNNRNVIIALITAVVIINYFEIYYHIWLLKLLGGYVIKIWLLPVALFCYMLARRFFVKDLHIPLEGIKGINVLIIFYFVIGLASLLIHEQPYYIGKYGLIMFAPLAMYAAIVDGLRDNRQIEKVLKILFIGGLFLSLTVLILFKIVTPSVWDNDVIKLKHMLTDVVDTYKLREFYHIHGFGYGNFVRRETLLGVDEPAFAAMLAPLILAGFYYAMNSTGLLRLFFYYISSFFMFYTLTNTLARSSLIAFIIGLIPFLWHIKKRIRDILIILIGITVIISANQAMQYRFIQLIGSTAQEVIDKSSAAQEIIDKVKTKVDFSGDGHIESLSKTLIDFKEAPFLGNGISYIEGKYKNDRQYAEHNRYLYILSTAGLLTVIPYAAFIIGLIVIARKTLLYKLKTNTSNFNIGLILYPSVLLFAIQINNVGMERYYYWIFFGLAAAWIRNTKKEIEK